MRTPILLCLTLAACSGGTASTPNAVDVVDAASLDDAGDARDGGGFASDASTAPDATLADDAGSARDAAAAVDANDAATNDAGSVLDATADAGRDAGALIDSGLPRTDAGSASDAGGLTDGGGEAGVDGGAAAVPGTGFATTATRWSVPPNGLADGFFSSAYTLGARGWLVIDLDADGLVDLVQTSDSQNGSGFVWNDLQGPYWRLFRGTGTGFATTPVRWAVPASGLADGFFAAYYASDTRYWGLADLDGDGRVELVQTGDPARSGGFVFTDAQGPYWRVWRSGSSGFTTSSTRFAVPASGLSDGFFATAYCSDARCWTLVDLDGDRYADLVQSADPTLSGGKVFSDTTGPYWKVWNGSANGFAPSPRRFGVPTSGLADGFFATSYASTAPGTRFWSLLDLDGDRRLDLVQSADPARSGGFVWNDAQGPSWRVFLGGASSFAAGVRMGVPASGHTDGFFATSYFASPTVGGERVWMTIDLDGDRRPELVQSADPSRTGGYVFSDVQGPYWKVWRLGLAGPTGPSRWSVPASGLSDGFFSPFWTDSTNGSRAWFMRDLDGDGRLDLVQTADTARSGLYVFSDAQGAYWKVYRGR
jgi:hypothetical protein